MICKPALNDAKVVIELLSLAMEDIALTLSGCSDFKSSNAVLERFFTAFNNRLSHENILVYKKNGKVLGAICFYRAKSSAFLDGPLRANLRAKNIDIDIEPECDQSSSELYIDSLAVAKSARGQGVAKKLIKAAQKRAQNQGLALSLIVDFAKPGVKKIYENLGFKIKGQKCINSHHYHYMIKESNEI